MPVNNITTLSNRTHPLRSARLLSVWLFACAIALPAMAGTSEKVEKECPLCSTKFEFELPVPMTRPGTRLDLKPNGLDGASLRLAVCPKCSFVVFKDEFGAKETDTLKALVASDDYKNLVKEGHPSYYLMAKIHEKTGADPFFIAYDYLHASWQVEQTDQKRCASYLELALRHISSVKQKTDGSSNEEWTAAQILTGELLRRLGKFEEAKSHFEKLSSKPEFKEQPFRGILAVELELAAAKNSAPASPPQSGTPGPLADDMPEDEE